MTRVYQVWALKDDLSIEDGFDDCKYIETDSKDVAVWFAENYKFDYTPNTVIRVEAVDIDDDGSEYCDYVVLESALEEK